MLQSTIRHGGVCYDLESSGAVTFTREATGQSVQLSPSEVIYLIAILQIHGWPTAPMNLLAAIEEVP